MSLARRLPHVVTIQRPVPGTEGERGQPAITWVPIQTVRGWLQPRKNKSTEAEQVAEAGSTVVLGFVWMLPTDVRTSDRLLVAADATPWYITAVEDPGGKGRHLELLVEQRIAAPVLGAV